MGIETSDKKADMQDFLDIPEHMLKMQESAFVPSYGGKWWSAKLDIV